MISEIKDYLDIVRSGDIAVCKEQRQFADFVESVFKNEKIYVNEEQLHKYLSYQKYFDYELFPWEVCLFTLHNCTYREDGYPRFPDLFILGGRGLGKNGYLSFEDFCLLTPTNGVKAYNIDLCAASEDQAKTSFNDIYNVLEVHKKKMRTHFYWTKELIKNKKTLSELRFRTSNSKTKDGGRPGKVDFDELHTYENYDMINVFKTGFGKKEHPRITYVTTNGDVRDGPLDHLIDRSLGILSGKLPDNGLLPFICRLDDRKEVHNPEAWVKANPSLPYRQTLKEEIKKEYEDFKADELSNSSFLTKRMNIPYGVQEAAVTSWDNILATSSKEVVLEGKTCIFGLDYARTTDFVSAGLLYKEDNYYYWHQHTWVCQQSPELQRIKFPLREAEQRGLLTFVNEVEIPPEVPITWIANMAKKCNVIAGAMDTYRYALMKKALLDAGWIADKESGNLKLIRPSNIMQVSPIISSAFANKKIIYGDDMLMRWFTNNTKSIVDANGNIRYGKIEPKTRKTDGFMAFVAAMCKAYILDENKINLKSFDVFSYG